jgi:uncharacterized protein (TIGR03118 family)
MPGGWTVRQSAMCVVGAAVASLLVGGLPAAAQPARGGFIAAVSNVHKAPVTPVPAGPTSPLTLGSRAERNEFHQTNLISDLPGQGAQLVDANLMNPWGLALGPTTPLWVANNASGVATVYQIPPGGASVTKVPLVVTIPGGRASTGDGPSPTGQVFNPSDGFGGARFIFASESGQITAWKPSDMSTAELKFSSPTAVYKGLTMASASHDTFLYAANFHDATVDVFDTGFHHIQLAGAFRDPSIPANYAPFGIQQINGQIYVTYAQQNAQKHDDVAGPGHGFIDIFSPEGFFLKRLASGGTLNSPWGMALAPETFGPFAHQLLVGDFGDGRINVFDPSAGHFRGQLQDEQAKPITIDDLWGLHVGTTTTAGTDTLLFSAGINDEHDGLVGTINATH